MTYQISFRNEGEMPDLPVSSGTTLYNTTGTWRYVRPVYRNKTSPCNVACPAGEDIAQYLGLVAKGKYQEARLRILEENPFPGVCGRVCPHPCESECNRAELGGSISIHMVERFLADLAGGAPVQRLPSNAPAGATVAIVGSGPAGLSCAYQLARRGYPVTVFEAWDDLGGTMRLGIPAYRLPRHVLDAEIAAIARLGVEMCTGRRLGDNLSTADLRAFSAVFLAVGQQKSRALEVAGEDAQGVVAGLDFLRRVNLGMPVEVGARVAVVGGGNTAMDAARAALRLGAQTVTVLYRRSRYEMPAIAEEVQEAQDEGICFEFLTTPVRVLTEDGAIRGLQCVRMQLGAPDGTGRRRPEPLAGSEYTLNVDVLIPALGQEADLAFLEHWAGGGLAQTLSMANGLLETDAAAQSSQTGIFVGGDSATGFGTVAHAVGSGKRAALAIDRYLHGEDLNGFPALDQHVHAAPRDLDPAVVRFADLNLAYFEELPRPEPKQRPAIERKRDFAEVTDGLDEQQVQQEAHRCFSCGTCNGCDTCWLYCPDVSISRVDHSDYQVNYDYCKGCGICAQECPRRAIVMEEELKWKK